MSKVLLFNADPAPEGANYTDAYLAALSHALAKKAEVTVLKITEADSDAIHEAAAAADKTVFAFPLCMDTLPPQLRRFFEETDNLSGRACGLISTDVLEFGHTDFAEPQLRLACERRGMDYACTMKIGGGPRLADGIYRAYLNMKLQKFAKQLLFDKDVNVGVQMPVGKSNFVLSGDRFVKKKAKPYGHKIIDL